MPAAGQVYFASFAPPNGSSRAGGKDSNGVYSNLNFPGPLLILCELYMIYLLNNRTEGLVEGIVDFFFLKAF